MTQSHDAGIALQVQNKLMNTLLNCLFIVAAKFNKIDSECRCVWVFREVFCDAVPDYVLHGQHEHFGIDCLDRQRLQQHQRLGVPQSIHEPRITHVHQDRILGDR
ncbi:hypothetical protein D3C80_1569150 [compost metagenome]